MSEPATVSAAAINQHANAERRSPMLRAVIAQCDGLRKQLGGAVPNGMRIEIYRVDLADLLREFVAIGTDWKADQSEHPEAVAQIFGYPIYVVDNPDPPRAAANPFPRMAAVAEKIAMCRPERFDVTDQEWANLRNELITSGTAWKSYGVIDPPDDGRVGEVYGVPFYMVRD
jgi:hypothetical protein